MPARRLGAEKAFRQRRFQRTDRRRLRGGPRPRRAGRQDRRRGRRRLHDDLLSRRHAGSRDRRAGGPGTAPHGLSLRGRRGARAAQRRAAPARKHRPVRERPRRRRRWRAQRRSMSRRGRLILLATLVVSDAFAIGFAALSAYLLAFDGALISAGYAKALALGLAPWLLSFAALRLYDVATVLEDSQEYATVATGCSYGILLLIVAVALAGGASGTAGVSGTAGGAGDTPAAGSGGLSLIWLFLFWIGSI